MGTLLKAKTLSVSINCEAGKVYKFVSNLDNFPKWAKTFCLYIKQSSGEWIAETPQGPVKIRLAGKNDLGVLDHYVQPAAWAELFVPMRVVANASGSELIFTVFQSPGLSDKNYAKDLGLVEQDLQSLKNIME